MKGPSKKSISSFVFEPLKQLYLLVRETVSLRLLLLNRFVIIIAILLVAIAGAQVYMQNNDDGYLRGTVVNSDGTPIGNASVELEVAGIENVVVRGETVTDPEGRFVFTNYSGATSGESVGMAIRLTVITEDGYETPTVRRHPYFPNQNMDVRLTVNPSEETS